MDAKERNTTIDAARRLIKSRMQQAICKAKVAELGEGDRIWGPMLNLADGFVEEAQEAWTEHLKATRIYRHVCLPHILEAVTQASWEAGLPYREQCDAVWLQKVIGDFLATFDPMEMTGVAGVA
jgi:hypothetical protein